MFVWYDEQFVENSPINKYVMQIIQLIVYFPTLMPICDHMRYILCINIIHTYKYNLSRWS